LNIDNKTSVFTNMALHTAVALSEVAFVDANNVTNNVNNNK